MLKPLRLLLRGIGWLLAFIVIVVIAMAAGSLIPRPLFAPAEAGVGQGQTIYLLANPIHTDIAIPLTDAIRQRFADLEPFGIEINHPGAAYLVIGWGGRSFYLETPTWSELKPAPVFKALTIDASVLHVDLAGSRLQNHPAATRIDVSEAGFERMLRYIETSFVRNSGQPVGIAGAGYNDTDAFFEATGSFNALLGCNTWTASALREAGVRTGLWNPLPQSLALSVDLYN
ncbi:uncharacterized protein (TIGR02117 family) [Rhizobium alvei]